MIILFVLNLLKVFNLKLLAPVPLKEESFIHTLIPAASVALLKVKQERTTLKDILKKLDNPMIRIQAKRPSISG